MAWTTPTDRLTGDVITAAQWNSWLGATGNMSLTATGIVTTQGDTVYATAANTLARLAKGTAYQVLGMNAGATAPSWQASPTSVLTTTGDVLYASGANTLARLAVGSTGQVLTVAAGVPSWATAVGSSVPTTTTGQILYASATNVLSALAVGTARQMLAMNSAGTLPTWQASAASTLTTTGDVLYASSANTLARLGVGSTGQVITVAGGVPTWATPGGSEWVKVSASTFTNVTSLDLTSLSGYKRYRLIFFMHSEYNNGGGFSSTIGSVTCELNGVTTAGAYYYNGTDTRGTTAPAYYRNNAANLSLTNARTVGGNGSTEMRGIFIQFNVVSDTTASYGLQANWLSSGITAVNYDYGSLLDGFWINGGGVMKTVQSSITAIKFLWTASALSLEGNYVLEGSNS